MLKNQSLLFLFACLFVCLSACLPANLSVSQSLCLSVCLLISLCESLSLSLSLFILFNQSEYTFTLACCLEGVQLCFQLLNSVLAFFSLLLDGFVQNIYQLEIFPQPDHITGVSSPDRQKNGQEKEASSPLWHVSNWQNPENIIMQNEMKCWIMGLDFGVHSSLMWRHFNFDKNVKERTSQSEVLKPVYCKGIGPY